MGDDWKLISTYVVLDKPEYLFDVDEWRKGEAQMVFLGLVIRKWSASVLKMVLREFKLFREHVTCPLYILGEEDDDKWAAFVALFGFKFLTNVICENGAQRRLFINVKEEKNVVHIDPGQDGHHGGLDHAEPVGGADAISTGSVQRSLGGS